MLLRQLAPLSAVDPSLVYNLPAGYIHDWLLNGSSNPPQHLMVCFKGSAHLDGDQPERTRQNGGRNARKNVDGY